MRNSFVNPIGKMMLRGILVLILVGIPFVGHTQPAQAAPLKAETWHYVQYGETLYSIAMHYGVSVSTLAYENGIANPNWIQAGTYLHISYGSGTPYPTPGGQWHYVIYGETLYSIAMRYGVSLWSLAYVNGITNPNYIRGGDWIYIP